MEKEEKKKIRKKDIAKAYEAYAKKFTPKPTYGINCIKAFLVGGAICTLGYGFSEKLISMGLKQEDAGTFVTITIVAIAQLLTAFGVFDTIAKFAGAGVIVPISGFANSMIAPAIEYKKVGPVLGAGAKMFTVAGPVLVCGIVSATIVGVIYWLLGQF